MLSLMAAFTKRFGTFIFHFSPFEAESADLSGFIGVLVDITEIRNMQRELQRLNDNLEQRVVEEGRLS